MDVKRIAGVVAALFLVAGAVSAQGTRNFQALSGSEAASYQLPSDVELVLAFNIKGLDYERYQQVFGSPGADVFNGQITVLRDSTGTPITVVASHYENLSAVNRVNVTAADARERSSRDIGPSGNRSVSLRIHPDSGRYFYEVDTRRSESRWIHWIDAGDGAVIRKFDGLTSESVGHGVQFSEDSTDVKDLTGLTTQSGGEYLLISADGRQETHDQGSTNRPFLGPVASDGDDVWDLLGDVSPAQQALVDAQYYAWVTDTYLDSVHTFDWVAQAIAFGANTKMEIHAHYTKDYNNAFWNGTYIALGDGDQSVFEELTALDVVSHELTHGVTEFTSDLIYQDESGALNESFSDIIGSATEFYAEANGLEPAVTLEPDWLIGEDFDLRGDTVPGFRNMGDPNEDGHPSHYEDRYTGGDDNGGVHINSGISNHWFYLLVNGGQNANADRASGTDVTGIGLAAAEEIAFLGFTALSENATFCDARAATTAVAGTFQPEVEDAWDEVGVICDGSTSNEAPTAEFTWTTSDLSVAFTDQSTDDGTIDSWLWDFGDSNTSTEQNPNHTYASENTYSVTLTVTDNDGATDTISHDVSVTAASEPDGFSLSVTAYKQRGLHKADLTWSGTTATSIDVYRDGALIATTANDGAYTDHIDQRGSATYTYYVCEAGTSTCSNEAQAIF